MTKKQKFEGEFEKIFKVLNRDMYNKKRKLYEYVKLGLTLRLLKKSITAYGINQVKVERLFDVKN